jgi:hypothetical protein
MTKKLSIISLTVACALLLTFTSIAHSEISAISWDELTDKDISPEARAALSIDKEAWKHAETDHFVYHFVEDDGAETFYIHAEVYYKWIKDFFGVAEDKWKKKNHIFIFTDEGAYNEFLKRIRRKGYDFRAYTTGWELFIYRKMNWMSSRITLAHELTHVIVFRFMEGPLPPILNEGFAQFTAGQLVNMKLDEAGNQLHFLKALKTEEYIPLKEAVEMGEYPEKNLQEFYEEGEWIVRFLTFNYGREELYEILRSAASGEDFKKSIGRICGINYEAFEDDFKKYALAKD